MRGLASPPRLMDPGRRREGQAEADLVRQPPGAAQRGVDSSEGRRRIAKIPQCPCPKGEAVNTRVIAIQRGVGAMLLGMVERHALLQVGTGASELSQPYQGIPQHMVGHEQELLLSDML